MSKEAWAWGQSPGNREHESEFLAEGIVHEKLYFPLFLGATNSVHCRLNCNVSALVQRKPKGKAGSSDQLCCQDSDQADQNGFFQGSNSFPRQAGGNNILLEWQAGGDNILLEWQALGRLLPQPVMSHMHLASTTWAVPTQVTAAWVGWMGAQWSSSAADKTTPVALHCCRAFPPAAL